jgi:hypothetical protein
MATKKSDHAKPSGVMSVGASFCDIPRSYLVVFVFTTHTANKYTIYLNISLLKPNTYFMYHQLQN